MSDSKFRWRDHKLVIGILLALAVWGGVFAAAAYRVQHVDHMTYDLRRSLIVLACVALFASFWLIMLWTRRGRKSRFNSHDPPP